MRDNISILVLIFGRWVGSSDSEYLANSLIEVDLNDLDSSSPIINNDIVDRVEPSNLNNILDLLEELSRGDHLGLIDRFFSSHLVAVLAPKDQAALAKYLHRMIRLKYASGDNVV